MLFGMNSGRFVLTQLLDLIHRQTLDRGVRLLDGGHRSQATELAWNLAQNFADVERSPV